MRIVHLTDLHFQCRPKLSELVHFKRFIGAINLYALGRKSKFDISVQRSVIAAAIAQDPDYVIITGDLTALSLDEEFEIAKRELTPLLEKCPAVIVAGNHDLYASREPPAIMKRLFGQWMGENSPHLHETDEFCTLSFETSIFDFLSRGGFKDSDLDKSAELLKRAGDRFVFMATHYPIWNRRGGLYGPWTRAVKKGNILAEWLKTQPVDALLHGHEHHGFQKTIQTEQGGLTIYNPGSSGYNIDLQRDRRAHFNVYTVENKTLTNLERFRYTPDGFEPEPGGPYASGR